MQYVENNDIVGMFSAGCPVTHRLLTQVAYIECQECQAFDTVNDRRLYLSASRKFKIAIVLRV